MTTCKWCQSEKTMKHGQRAGVQRCLCNECGHKFYNNENSFARMRVNDYVIVTALNLYYSGLSTRRVREQISDIFGETVAQSTVLYWIHKFGSLVNEYVACLKPQLGGKYHHDETAIFVGGEEKWFWERIDGDTRFIVAHLVTNSRTTRDAKNVFGQALEKQRPTGFTGGSFVYDKAVGKVFYSRYKANQVEWVRRVGIRARETNNIVERSHGTLKDRLKPMRGLKNIESTQELLSGYVVNCNFCQTHSAIGKTLAQAAGIEVKGWKQLIQNAMAQRTFEEVRDRQELLLEVNEE